MLKFNYFSNLFLLLGPNRYVFTRSQCDHHILVLRWSSDHFFFTFFKFFSRSKWNRFRVWPDEFRQNVYNGGVGCTPAGHARHYSPRRLRHF